MLHRPQRWMLCIALAIALGATGDVLSTWLTRGELEDADALLLAACAGLGALAWLRRPLAARVSVAVIALTLSIGFAEIALVAVGNVVNGPSASPGWSVWPPDYRCVVMPNDAPGVTPRGKFSTNALGLRGTTLPQPGDYKILCIGGSTTECLYLDDARTWPAVLQHELAQHGGRVWVGNAGRSGLTTVDHLTLLRNWAPGDAMDCWVVLCGVNDMGLQLTGVYDDEAQRSWHRTFGYRRPGWVTPLQRPLYRNLYTWCLAERGWDRLRRFAWLRPREACQDVKAAWFAELRRQRQSSPQVSEMPDLDALLAEYEHNLRQLIQLANQRGKRLVLLTQPVLWHAGMKSELENLCWTGRCPDGRYRSTSVLATAMAAYNRRLVEVCGATGTECVDLVAQIEPSTASFYDDCHFNDAGAQRVGQIVASAMTADEDHPLVTKNRPEATVEEMARLPDRRSGSETGVSQDSRP